MATPPADSGVSGPEGTHRQVAPGVYRVGATLEELTPSTRVRGVLVHSPVTVISVRWHGSNALTLTYRDDTGRPDQRLLYRDHEPSAAHRRGDCGLACVVVAW